MDETYFGVYEDLLYARKINPVQGSPLRPPPCVLDLSFVLFYT